MFRPAKPLPTVAQVTFEGNQVIPQDKLREAIAGAVGASYTEDSFRQTLNSVVRPLYENKGYLRVTFPELRTEKATEDVEGLHVFVTVHEGVSYELGKVTIDGPTPIAPRRWSKPASSSRRLGRHVEGERGRRARPPRHSARGLYGGPGLGRPEAGRREEDWSNVTHPRRSPARNSRWGS